MHSSRRTGARLHTAHSPLFREVMGAPRQCSQFLTHPLLCLSLLPTTAVMNVPNPHLAHLFLNQAHLQLPSPAPAHFVALSEYPVTAHLAVPATPTVQQTRAKLWLKSQAPQDPSSFQNLPVENKVHMPSC